jgi:hypothetical protein
VGARGALDASRTLLPKSVKHYSGRREGQRAPSLKRRALLPWRNALGAQAGEPDDGARAKVEPHALLRMRVSI